MKDVISQISICRFDRHGDLIDTALQIDRSRSGNRCLGINRARCYRHAWSRIDQLYAKLQEQAADPMKMGAVQGQYSQFNSAQTIISNLHYNDAVQSYQKDVGGFPASVLGKLFGIQEVELFA